MILSFSPFHPVYPNRIIFSQVMKAVINEIIPGASVIDICSFGDKMILDETAKHYKKDKQLKKGIAFPTCICVNEV